MYLHLYIWLLVGFLVPANMNSILLSSLFIYLHLYIWLLVGFLVPAYDGRVG